MEGFGSERAASGVLPSVAVRLWEERVPVAATRGVPGGRVRCYSALEQAGSEFRAAEWGWWELDSPLLDLRTVTPFWWADVLEESTREQVRDWGEEALPALEMAAAALAVDQVADLSRLIDARLCLDSLKSGLEEGEFYLSPSPGVIGPAENSWRPVTQEEIVDAEAEAVTLPMETRWAARDGYTRACVTAVWVPVAEVGIVRLTDGQSAAVSCSLLADWGEARWAADQRQLHALTRAWFQFVLDRNNAAAVVAGFRGDGEGQYFGLPLRADSFLRVEGA